MNLGSTDFKLEAAAVALESDNIYLDTSWILPDLVTRAVAAVGARRVLFSSDAPLSALGIEIGCRRAARLTDAERDQVMGGIMLRLLGEAP